MKIPYEIPPEISHGHNKGIDGYYKGQDIRFRENLNLDKEELQQRIEEVLEYLDNSNISWIDKNEIVVRLKGDE